MMPLSSMIVTSTYHDFKTWKAAVIAAGFETFMYADVENGPSSDDMWDPCFAIDPKTNWRRSECDVVGVWRCEWRPDPQSDDDHDWVGYLFQTKEAYDSWQAAEYEEDARNNRMGG